MPPVDSTTSPVFSALQVGSKRTLENFFSHVEEQKPCLCHFADLTLTTQYLGKLKLVALAHGTWAFFPEQSLLYGVLAGIKAGLCGAGLSSLRNRTKMNLADVL